MITPQTCAIGIVTYKRPDMLMECLQAVVNQTRPPQMIAIADASPDADLTEERIQKEFPTIAKQFTFIFLKTPAGIPIQRNAILDAIDQDVILFIDDDSLLNPDFVEHLLPIYEADINKEVGGVEGVAIEGSQLVKESASKNVNSRRVSIHEAILWCRAKYLGPFFPKETFIPIHPIPEKLKLFHVTARSHLYGCIMSYRVPIAKKNRFNENLKKYAFMEDFEFSYRVNKTHALLQCDDCKAQHLKHLGGRMDPSLVHYFYLINLAYICRTALDFTPEVSAYVLKHAKKFARFEYVLGFIRSTGFKQYYGSLAGYEETKKILAASPQNLNVVYEASVQKGLEKEHF
jgi:GT2 family glycosyltransferase